MIFGTGCDAGNERNTGIFLHDGKLEDLVPVDRPLRPVRLLVKGALQRLNVVFGIIYADLGRSRANELRSMRRR